MHSRFMRQCMRRGNQHLHRLYLNTCPSSGAWHPEAWTGMGMTHASGSRKQVKLGVSIIYTGSCTFRHSSPPSAPTLSSALNPSPPTCHGPFVPLKGSAMTILPRASAPVKCAHSGISVPPAGRSIPPPGAPPAALPVLTWAPRVTTPINPHKLSDLLQGCDATERLYLVVDAVHRLEYSCNFISFCVAVSHSHVDTFARTLLHVGTFARLHVDMIHVARLHDSETVNKKNRTLMNNISR